MNCCRTTIPVYWWGTFFFFYFFLLLKRTFKDLKDEKRKTVAFFFFNTWNRVCLFLIFLINRKNGKPYFLKLFYNFFFMKSFFKFVYDPLLFVSFEFPWPYVSGSCRYEWIDKPRLPHLFQASFIFWSERKLLIFQSLVRRLCFFYAPFWYYDFLLTLAFSILLTHVSTTLTVEKHARIRYGVNRKFIAHPSICQHEKKEERVPLHTQLSWLHACYSGFIRIYFKPEKHICVFSFLRYQPNIRCSRRMDGQEIQSSFGIWSNTGSDNWQIINQFIILA